MTEHRDDVALETRIVVVLDMCSSSKILEDLKLSDNLRELRDLLISVKKFLKQRAEEGMVEVHKFIGDGWVLLFPTTTSGEDLVTFLEDLSRLFRKEMETRILPRLQKAPPIIGLTFGIDSGALLKMIMMGNTEYIGRPLNIACRLQKSIKEGDRSPGYKVLFSRPSFRGLRLRPGFRKCVQVTRDLANIQGGDDYECVKMTLQL